MSDHMPRYKKDVEARVEPESVQAMMGQAGSAEEAALIAYLFRTGARPVELQMLRGQDVFRSGGRVNVKLRTAKNGISRTIGFRPGMRFVREMEDFAATRTRLFPHDTSWMRKVVDRLSHGKLTPYTFRHNRLTRLAEAGASINQLMLWKGARDVKSISQYLYLNPALTEKMADVE